MQIKKFSRTDSLQRRIQHLLEELSTKNNIIDIINKEKDDARWQLGEHRQWLTDANNRYFST